MFYYNKRSKLSAHTKHLFSFMAAKLLLIIRTMKQRRLEGSHATLEVSNHCEHLPFLQFVVANFIKYHKESPQRHEFCDIFCNFAANKRSELMEEHNVLTIVNRREFRAWLEANHAAESECWVCVKRGRPADEETFWYLDAVEEALCFGWIDSRHKLIDGRRMQCFTPRKRNSPWTEPLDSIYAHAQGKSWQLLTPRIGEQVRLNEQQIFSNWW